MKPKVSIDVPSEVDSKIYSVKRDNPLVVHYIVQTGREFELTCMSTSSSLSTAVWMVMDSETGRKCIAVPHIHT